MSFHVLNLLLTGLLVLLAGCAGTSPAPVRERASPSLIERSAASVVPPGHYLVKKGDTLYGIALDNGQDHKDIAAWNQLDNPNLIKVGQVLRVVPPEGETSEVATTSPVAPPDQIESRTPGQQPVPQAVVAADGVKREPIGRVLPYSDAAWAQTKHPMQIVAAPAAAQPAASPAVPPIEPKPAVVAVAEGDPNWAWPSTNKVSETFSEGSNKGLNFSGKIGEPVLAAAAGKVTLVTNSLRGYGNLIVIKHNTQYLSVYAHNSKMLVSEGQSIARGQKIAEIGSSDTDQPKLHFEIRREGKPVDPSKYLPPR